MPWSHVRQTQGIVVYEGVALQLFVVHGHIFQKWLVIELVMYDVLGSVESYLKEVSFRMVTLYRPTYHRRQIVADVGIIASKIHYISWRKFW